MERLLHVHQTRPTNVSALIASWDYYLATLKKKTSRISHDSSLQEVSEDFLYSHLLPETLRVCLYNIYVLSILLYRCGTWCSTDRDISGLEAHHRRQLRCVLRIHYLRPPSATQIFTSAATQNQSESTWRGIDGGTVVVSQPLPTQLNIFRYFDSAGTCPSRTPFCPNHSRQGPKTRDNF